MWDALMKVVSITDTCMYRHAHAHTCVYICVHVRVALPGKCESQPKKSEKVLRSVYLKRKKN